MYYAYPAPTKLHIKYWKFGTIWYFDCYLLYRLFVFSVVDCFQNSKCNCEIKQRIHKGTLLQYRIINSSWIDWKSRIQLLTCQYNWWCNIKCEVFNPLLPLHKIESLFFETFVNWSRPKIGIVHIDFNTYEN